MRGFYADERVDGKIWNLKNPVFLAVFKFFKRKELEFIREADYSVSLTENGKLEILSWESFKDKSPLIKVIPCCADLDHFSKDNYSQADVLLWRKKLGLQEEDFVLVYLGSLGTWYMVKEMLQYFSRLLLVKPAAKLLMITTDDARLVKEHLASLSIPEKQVVITAAKRNEVPALLSIADFSLFFILPVYSKKASSPTKLAELMALSVPVVCNAGVGDVDRIVEQSHAGIVLHAFDNGSYDAAIQQMLNYRTDATKLREAAIEYASLETGVKRYREIYQLLLGY
jgi:glycosyltransferase involved in cell wall biosynthesis